jgi:Glycosyltransferase Family 4
VNDLAKVTAVPEIIHGQHNHELFTALLRFPGVPAVRICHGWLDEPPQPFPRVLRYVAVDDTTRDRCVYEWGVPEDRLEVLLNFVDLEKFTPRGPLPNRPARALVLSNNAQDHLWAVASACATMGIAVEAMGHDSGNATANPERVLGRYDIVFAKGRAALEAMASGAAVILCDRAGVGPMVTTAELPRLRRLNFGIRTLQEAVAPEPLKREIARYDASDAQEVTQQIRATADAGGAIELLIALYRNVIAEHREGGPDDGAEELRAASAYLQQLGPRLRWADEPRAAVYPLLRSIYGRARTIPGVAAVARSPWIQRLVLKTRARWRARASGSS